MRRDPGGLDRELKPVPLPNGVWPNLSCIEDTCYEILLMAG
jgi:hypothetical protein